MDAWSSWVLVGDIEKCEHTKKQVEICKGMKMPLKGAILCNDPQHAETEACFKVPAFPCFCDTKTSLCVSGLRETAEDFDELLKMAEDELKKK